MSVNIPNITSDGLVFGYDSSASSRFSPGPPLRNVAASISFGYGNQNSSLFKKQNSTYTAVIPNVGTRTVYAVETYNDYNGGSGNCCLSLFNFGGGVSVSSSTPYTYQIIYRTKNDNVGTNYMYHYEYGPSGYLTEYGLHSTSRRTALGDGWWHAWGQFTSHASATSFGLYLFHYEYAVHNKVEVADVSLTAGSSILKPSQFPTVGTTRANTASLLDIKGACTYNVGGITYDSTGYPYFDGTNDYIDLGSLTTFANTRYTVEAVIKCYKMPSGTAASDIQNILGHSTITENAHYLCVRAKRIAFWNVSSTGGGAAVTWYSSNTDLVVNTYYHISFVCDNGYYYIYVNGVLDSSLSYMGTGENNLSLRYVGQLTNERYFYGEIPQLKGYNKALTATEISNNYMSYKGRYGF